jgi:hypothetical protein
MGTLQLGGTLWTNGTIGPDDLDPYATLPAQAIRCLEIRKSLHGGAAYPAVSQALSAYNSAVTAWDASTGERILAEIFHTKLLSLGIV